MSGRSLKAKRRSLTQDQDIQDLQRAVDEYVAKNPTHRCSVEIKLEGRVIKRMNSEGKRFKGTLKEQAAKKHQPDMRTVLKQVQENGHIVRPKPKKRAKREFVEPIDYITIKSSQSQSTDSTGSQSPVIKRERELRGPSPGIIDLSSDEDQPGFDLSEGLTQPGDDLPLTTIISGNLPKNSDKDLSDENSSSQDLFDPEKPSTSTQITKKLNRSKSFKSLRRQESVTRIFDSDDSSSEDEGNTTIKNEPEEGSYSPLSQELCKNENDSSEEPEELDEDDHLDRTRAHSQNLFETSDIWSHFNDENYPTRYR